MKRGMTLSILVIFAGYTVASYGYVLVRGWNIPFRQWVSPLDPYQWPGKKGALPPAVPRTSVWPRKIQA